MPTHLRRFLPLLLAVCLTPATALAWQAGGDGRVCTLAHREDGVDVILTYDAAGPLYTITVTQPEPWPPAPLFSMIFDGAAPFTITTDRHVLSNGDRSLTVTDRGFGNVLRGLAENTTARCRPPDPRWTAQVAPSTHAGTAPCASWFFKYGRRRLPQLPKTPRASD